MYRAPGGNEVEPLANLATAAARLWQRFESDHGWQHDTGEKYEH
jgi:hypothetical protein